MKIHTSPSTAQLSLRSALLPHFIPIPTLEHEKCSALVSNRQAASSHSPGHDFVLLLRDDSFETMKPHLQRIFFRTPHSDPVETIEPTPQPHAWDPNPGINSEDEAEYHEQMPRERLHIREMFKRARASGSQEELRRACFSVIPFMGHESDELEVLGPLAPLPSNSRFTGKGAVFDMATETRVYREL
ncbi:hypothetical protein V8E51_007052 [Hyaloscypha variabilis]